jgi:hypothetical protein
MNQDRGSMKMRGPVYFLWREVRAGLDHLTGDEGLQKLGSQQQRALHRLGTRIRKRRSKGFLQSKARNSWVNTGYVVNRTNGDASIQGCFVFN